jgi:hypothetical protein
MIAEFKRNEQWKRTTDWTMDAFTCSAGTSVPSASAIVSSFWIQRVLETTGAHAQWAEVAYLDRLCRWRWGRCRGVFRRSTGLPMASSAVRVMWFRTRRRRQQISNLEFSLYMRCESDTYAMLED